MGPASRTRRIWRVLKRGPKEVYSAEDLREARDAGETQGQIYGQTYGYAQGLRAAADELAPRLRWADPDLTAFHAALLDAAKMCEVIVLPIISSRDSEAPR